MANNKQLIHLLIAINLILIGFIFGYFFKNHSESKQKIDQQSNILFNEYELKNLNDSSLDLKLMNVFDHVFLALAPEIDVLPTENYYYWSFNSNNHKIRGNFRLDANDRDQGLISFAFFSAHPHPQEPEDLDFITDSSNLGKPEGITVTKINYLKYDVTYKNKTVTFNLNNVSQQKPNNFPLHEYEQFVERTYDESGWQFILIFNNQTNQFSFIQDPTAPAPEITHELEPNLQVGRLSGFAFNTDNLKRNVLIGVASNNIRSNSYYDGPFDQLADNFPPENLKTLLEKAYPYVTGRISNRGIFLGNEGQHLESRLALTPYFTYNSMPELMDFIANCQSEKSEQEKYSCLTYDYKKDTPK